MFDSLKSHNAHIPHREKYIHNVLMLSILMSVLFCFCLADLNVYFDLHKVCNLDNFVHMITPCT